MSKLSDGAPPRAHKRRERREFKRIKKLFIARFKILRTKDGVSEPVRWNMVTIKNIGAKGALFNYSNELPLSSLLDLKINFPQSRTPITCKAEVLRVEKPQSSVIFNIAAVFVEVKEKEKELINSAAEMFYSKKEGEIEP